MKLAVTSTTWLPAPSLHPNVGFDAVVNAAIHDAALSATQTVCVVTLPAPARGAAVVVVVGAVVPVVWAPAGAARTRATSPKAAPSATPSDPNRVRPPRDIRASLRRTGR